MEDNLQKSANIILVTIAVIVVVMLGVTWVWPGVWVEREKAISALATQGFTNIIIEDKDVTFLSMRGCGSGDAAAFQAKARNPLGAEVPVNVCCGWPLKGCTIRSD